MGSNLAQVLVRDAGAAVTIVDAMVPESGANLRNLQGIEKDLELHIGSIGDPGLMGSIIERSELVFNLAGSISHLDSMQDPVADFHANCREHLAFLETCRRQNPHLTIVLPSTRQVYGRPQRLPVDEEHPCRPVDLNGIHKLACEKYCLLWSHLCGLRVVILRLTNTYGPRQLLRHPRQGFIGWFVKQALSNESIHLYGGGQQRRDFNYVEDVVEAMLMAAAAQEKTAGRIYNLGAERAYSLKECAQLLVELAPGTSLQIEEFPADRLAIDIGSYWADFSRLRNELGWFPRTSLREGLRWTLDYYRERLDWYLP